MTDKWCNYLAIFPIASPFHKVWYLSLLSEPILFPWNLSFSLPQFSSGTWTFPLCWPDYETIFPSICNISGFLSPSGLCLFTFGILWCSLVEIGKYKCHSLSVTLNARNHNLSAKLDFPLSLKHPGIHKSIMQACVEPSRSSTAI